MNQILSELYAVIDTVINPTAWVFGNLLVAYDSVAILMFTVSYFVWFDPRATTGGKLIFRFFVSLLGVITLVFIGTFIDPAGDRIWLDLPSDVDLWRPVFRVIVYGYIGVTTTSLYVLLVIRKWRPSKTKAEPDLVKVRRETSEIKLPEN